MNFPYNVGRGKLDYPSLFSLLSICFWFNPFSSLIVFYFRCWISTPTFTLEMFISWSVYSLDDLRFQNKSFQAFFDSVDPEKRVRPPFPSFYTNRFSSSRGWKEESRPGKVRSSAFFTRDKGCCPFYSQGHLRNRVSCRIVSRMFISCVKIEYVAPVLTFYLALANCEPIE